MSNPLAPLAALVFLAACAAPLAVETRAALPAPVANNAVAYARDAKGEGTIYSFLGLGAGKTAADIVSSAYACPEATLDCRAISGVPVSEGRLAGVAATVGGKIYLFGGYTVAPDGAEIVAFAFAPA